MLDQSIWWFSFFMACCERTARLYSRMEKAEDRESLLWSETWCCLTVCHPNLARLKAESNERGAAKSEWGWEISVLFFPDMQDTQLPVLVGQLFFPCKWLLSVGENSQTKLIQMLIHAWAVLGNSMSSDSLSGFLLPLAETGAQGVIAMLSGPLIIFHCLT